MANSLWIWGQIPGLRIRLDRDSLGPMKRTSSLRRLLGGWPSWLVALGVALTAHGAGSSTAKSLFQRPTREYSSGPLWVWNDLLTEEQIVSTLRDLAGQHVKQVFVHPRPGLMTPYLSEDWFRLWKAALSEAERLDMNVWIYDENSYPSGFAGGFVPEAMPEARGRGLVFSQAKEVPHWKAGMIAVFRLEADHRFTPVTDALLMRTNLGSGQYLVATMVRAGDSPWHGGRCYVDLLYPGVTEKFIEITLEPYRREVGHEFGKRVPGTFTDEPHLRPAGRLPWTEDLPERFFQRWGYSLLDHLPSLNAPVGDWRRVRHNYFQLLHELFVARWAKPMHDYCAAHQLEFTGHYWEHEWPNCLLVPDNMAMYAWHQRPAIDILMNQYREDTHAQFGNVRAVRELSSVANQLGIARTLCEAYGAGGWDLRFEDMKRIGDWLYVLGVNTLDQHLSYITLRGARKRDHPQSFSYHEPWWSSYHYSAEYFDRLTAALCQGQQLNPVLVLEPTTTAWLYNSGGAPEARLKEIGASFQSLLLALEKDQVEYDLGCEDIMARHGAAAGAGLKIGQRLYSLVVLPPFLENLNRRTADLLDQYLQRGGTILACGDPPSHLEGQPTDRTARWTQAKGWIQTTPAVLSREIFARIKSDCSITREDGDQGLLFHHRRRLPDGDLVFLVNTSLEHPTRGALRSAAGSVERWDPQTGQITLYPWQTNQGRIETRFELPPSGSLLLLLAQRKLSSPPIVQETFQALAPVSTAQPKRIAPNVLVLDFVDIKAGGEALQNVYFYKASQFAFQKNGLPRNPWDSAVQFKDEFLKLTFPTNSGFEAVYRFQVGTAVPSALSLVVERPDLYQVACNGQPVTPAPGAWWLDKAFGRIDITSAVKSGENTITLTAHPFSIYHELEPVYLLGHFTLQPVEKGFRLEAEAELPLGPWNEKGHPFYSEGVVYGATYDLADTAGKARVALPSWRGSVARVLVNGAPAGIIAYPPFECDITRHLRKGENLVEVMVIGTLKNTLGPHHAGPGLGSAWPGMFQAGPASGPPPGASYATVGYGLFEPFVVKQAVTAAPPQTASARE